MTAADFLDAARVPTSVQPRTFGAWRIERRERWDHAIPSALSRDTFTLLMRTTMATLHQDGEVVMEDSDPELMRHLPIWLRASGRVLVSGLGLGCVVRGLLASNRVDHVDVVELDAAILRVVGPEFAGAGRVTLHCGDALTIPWPDGTTWDYAWHDVWCDGPGLHRLHAQLLMRYIDRCRAQGAWAFPRPLKRCFRRMIGGYLG